MHDDDLEIMEQQFKQVALVGFEEGFRTAIALIKDFSENREEPSTKNIANSFAKFLSGCLPAAVKAAEDKFVFHLLSENIPAKITYH